jgi:hypothetical protein
VTALRFTTAREVFVAFPQAAEYLTAAPTDDPPPVFMRALANSPTPEDALTFCAFALGRREAVWWGCQCVRLVEGNAADLNPFLQAAEGWVRDPEEENRRAALSIGMASDRQMPGPWLALAAGWSGGSMSPVEGSPVPPPPHLTGSAVRGAVLMSLARTGAKERGALLSACVDGGLRLMEPAKNEPR